MTDLDATPTADQEKAVTFLKAHYQADDLSADQVRRDRDHWEAVAGDPARFPNADLDYIDRFVDAADNFLVMP